MGKLDRLKLWYTDEGVVGLLKAVWVTSVYLTPLYPGLERILGERLHEKLIRAPRLGYWPDITSPRSFNEKVLHRKLYTNKKLYTTVADKWEVREFVKKIVGDEILNEVYHVTDDPQTIPFEELPDKFVIKATHGCGWNIIVQDKNEEDVDEIRTKCEEWLGQRYGPRQREYWYEDIEPKIIVERFLEGDNGKPPRDHKIYVFNGDAKYTHVDFDRFNDPSRRFFDREWTAMDFQKGGLPLGPKIDKPDHYEEMIATAERLGADFDFARVDLYQPEEDTIIFGEITLAPGSGISLFDPVARDFEFGSYW